jgi:predicted outer membrane repeat protein
MIYPPAAPTKVLSESKSGTNTRRGDSINKKQHPNLLQGSFKQNKTSGNGGGILGTKITNT